MIGHLFRSNLWSSLLSTKVSVPNSRHTARGRPFSFFLFLFFFCFTGYFPSTSRARTHRETGLLNFFIFFRFFLKERTEKGGAQIFIRTFRDPDDEAKGLEPAREAWDAGHPSSGTRWNTGQVGHSSSSAPAEFSFSFAFFFLPSQVRLSRKTTWNHVRYKSSGTFLNGSELIL